MSNLTLRILSAAALVLVGFGALVLDLRARWIVLTAVLAIGAWELSRLAGRKFAAPLAPWLASLAVVALCVPHFPGFQAPALWNWGVVALSLAVLIAVAFARVPITVVAPWVLINAFVVGYLGLWGGKIFELMYPFTGVESLAPFVFTLACIAAADTGAYFTGRAFGKRKLAPSISSGKTREGAVGGVAASLLVSALLARFAGLTIPAALLLGAVLAAASVMGDLFISAIKRWANAKDTSAIIPGHGGVMDRFDALIFAAPFAWLGFQLLR
jgi:phosphatidate cytidylyltransferase